MSCYLPRGDRELVQIVDAALAEATRRSGHWLACRPGCSQCCVGVFAISQLDAARLQRGLEQLERREPERAKRIRRRAAAAWKRMKQNFPGNVRTGTVDESDPRFEEFGNDEVCPVLDRTTGLCELYTSRPLTCRAYGPPVETEGGIGVCELCFQGASDAEITQAVMQVDPDGRETELVAQIKRKTGQSGATIIAFALSR